MGIDYTTNDEHLRSKRDAGVHAEQIPAEAVGGQVEGLDSTPLLDLVTDRHINGRGNSPVRAAAIQRLQRSYGNRAVQRMLAVQRFSDSEEQVTGRQDGAGSQAATAPQLQAQEPEHASSRGADNSVSGLQEGEQTPAPNGPLSGETQEVEEPEHRQSRQGQDDDQQNLPENFHLGETILPGTVIQLAKPLATPGGLVPVSTLTVLAGSISFTEEPDGVLRGIVAQFRVAVPLVTARGGVTTQVTALEGRLETASPLVPVPGVHVLTGGSLFIPDELQIFTGEPVVPGKPVSPTSGKAVITLGITGGRLVTA